MGSQCNLRLQWRDAGAGRFELGTASITSNVLAMPPLAAVAVATGFAPVGGVVTGDAQLLLPAAQLEVGLGQFPTTATCMAAISSALARVSARCASTERRTRPNRSSSQLKADTTLILVIIAIGSRDAGLLTGTAALIACLRAGVERGQKVVSRYPAWHWLADN